jgi:hypothetical protein
MGAMLFAASGFAQTDATPAEPTVLMQHGIRYVSGGIGEDEAAAMNKMAEQYSLRVMVAGQGGEYLSDVDVTIASAAGKQIFAARTDGPFLLVRLPAGHYRVSATNGQATATHAVVVPPRGTARLDLHLKQP